MIRVGLGKVMTATLQLIPARLATRLCKARHFVVIYSSDAEKQLMPLQPIYVDQDAPLCSRKFSFIHPLSVTLMNVRLEHFARIS